VGTDFFYKNADVYAIKIILPKGYTVNSIKRFISKKTIDYTDLKSAVMFGFRGETIHECELDERNITYINATENKDESDLKLVIKGGSCGRGNSGSPLFLELKNSKIVFGGICLGGVIDNPEAVFVQPSYLKESIKKASLLPPISVFY
jgi:hypothetical protein